jgi:hypothetical protein
VYAPGRYFRSIGEDDTLARVGSRAFLGSAGREPDFVRIVREREPLAVGETVDGMRVSARIPLTEARRRGLFRISVEGAGWLSRELAGGKSSAFVRAYWFGRFLRGRKASLASEIRSNDERVHITCYVDPAEFKAGKTHCLPGKESPRRELQIVSRPLADPIAAREVMRLERGGGGREITLATGERVVAYARAIVTPTTLVTVVGSIDICTVARTLRPL